MLIPKLCLYNLITVVISWPQKSTVIWAAVHQRLDPQLHPEESGEVLKETGPVSCHCPELLLFARSCSQGPDAVNPSPEFDSCSIAVDLISR